jgi:hypothetical protein
MGVDFSRPSTLSTSPRSSFTGCRRAEERGWRVLSHVTHPDPTYGSGSAIFAADELGQSRHDVGGIFPE